MGYSFFETEILFFKEFILKKNPLPHDYDAKMVKNEEKTLKKQILTLLPKNKLSSALIYTKEHKVCF